LFFLNIFSDAIKTSPSIEPEFHYCIFRSPPVEPVQFGAMRVKFPFYTRLF